MHRLHTGKLLLFTEWHAYKLAIEQLSFLRLAESVHSEQRTLRVPVVGREVQYRDSDAHPFAVVQGSTRTYGSRAVRLKLWIEAQYEHRVNIEV